MSESLQHPTHLPFEAPLWTVELTPSSRLMVRTRTKLEHKLIVRALRDPAFRHELVAHPKPLVEAELGYKLPDLLSIEVLEESVLSRYLVIPHNGITDDTPGHISVHVAAEWVLDGRRTALLEMNQAYDLLAQVWSDEAFKAQLLRDPAAVLKEVYGVHVEHGARVHVRLETPEHLFIVIPDLFGYNELDDSDYAEFVSFVNEPMVIGSNCCTVKTTESPYGCGCH
jgi:hypothetical protein